MYSHLKVFINKVYFINKNKKQQIVRHWNKGKGLKTGVEASWSMSSSRQQQSSLSSTLTLRSFVFKRRFSIHDVHYCTLFGGLHLLHYIFYLIVFCQWAIASWSHLGLHGNCADIDFDLDRHTMYTLCTPVGMSTWNIIIMQRFDIGAV